MRSSSVGAGLQEGRSRSPLLPQLLRKRLQAPTEHLGSEVNGEAGAAAAESDELGGGAAGGLAAPPPGPPAAASRAVFVGPVWVLL